MCLYIVAVLHDSLSQEPDDRDSEQLSRFVSASISVSTGYRFEFSPGVLEVGWIVAAAAEFFSRRSSSSGN